MTGECPVQMDEKFRISLPSEFKDELINTTRVITRSMDSPSLQIITLEKFAEIEKMLESIPNPEFDKNYLAIQRYFIAPSVKIEFDKTLRIMIPRGLRKTAKLEPKASVTILGMKDKIEIWDSGVYNAYTDNSMENIMDCISNLREQLNKK